MTNKPFNSRVLHLALMFGAVAGCGQTSVSSPLPNTDASTPAATPVVAEKANALSMRLDGREWHADRAIDVILHPPGFDRMLMVSGSFGPKDRNEQAFNLNLVGVDGPGRYTIKGGSMAGNAIQLANLSPEQYLIGGALGAEVVVEISVLQSEPPIVEGTFSGTLNASNGNVLRVEDGRFSYRN